MDLTSRRKTASESHQQSVNTACEMLILLHDLQIDAQNL
jgi:hypothetical protein